LNACPECGSPVNERMKFCAECGARLVHELDEVRVLVTLQPLLAPVLKLLHQSLQIPPEIRLRHGRQVPGTLPIETPGYVFWKAPITHKRKYNLG